MPSNPIQRKSRNAFFLGVLVMLILAVVVAGVLYITIFKKEKETEKKEVVAYVYALLQPVRAGEEITSEMVQEVKVLATAAPTDSIPSKIQGTDGKLFPSSMLLGYKSKISLNAGTILSQSMLYEGEDLKDGERLVEYNMLTLPMSLNIGDYIDIRLTLPNGQDLIVVSKKEIKDLYGNTLTLHLTEEEILMMNSAIVEAYIMTASNLYAIKYIEPGLQTATVLTYVPTEEVQRLIYANPNITDDAKNSLQSKFYASTESRTGLNVQTGQYTEERKQNIETGIQKQIEAAKQAREAYLSGLSGI